MDGMAGEPDQRSPSDADDREALFDAYVDLVLAGEAPDGAAFLARTGREDPELAARLDAVRAARGACPDEAPAADGVDDPWPGRTLGGFRIEARLGEGGMGVVYRATDLALHRPVALKLLPPAVAGSPAARQRFEREAKAVARLRHANIVPIHSVGTADGVRFLVMELVEGQPLDELLAEARERGERLPATRVVHWVRDLADALEAAHAAGIVHRDVKAANVQIRPDDRALLLDFGIARDAEGEATLTDTFVGSPHTMAPERIGRRSTGAVTDDPRSDVYALGVVLWECLAGRPPFDAPTLERLFHAILVEDPPSLRSVAPETSRDLETIVLKAMARDPARRYASAALLRDDLTALLEFRPIAARPDGMARTCARWVRRHAALSAALAVGLLASVALLASLALQQHMHEAADRDASLAAIAEARKAIAEFTQAADQASVDENRFAEMSRLRLAQYLSAEEDSALDRLGGEVQRGRLQRGRVLDHALQQLAVAERLGAPLKELRELRADLFAAQYADAVRHEDAELAATLRTLVRDNDPDGSHMAQLDVGGTLSVASDCPGTKLWLYRLVDHAALTPSGESRVVGVAFDGSQAIDPGRWCLEVVRDHPPLVQGDLLVAIDGSDVATTAERDGARAAERLAAGARTVERVTPTGLAREELTEPLAADLVRFTTRPLPRVIGASLGQAPCVARPIPRGSYVLVARAPGRSELRWVFRSVRGLAESVCLTPPATEGPPGFLPVVVAGTLVWLMEREVTVEEYLAFLNDPATLARIKEASAPILVPRSSTGVLHLVPGADGRFAIPNDWRPDWPVLGISWSDAAAYAAWRSEQASSKGEGWTFALPSDDEWLAATGVGSGARYVFGNQWRPKWVSSAFAEPKATPRPVRSYPRDESALGFYDLAGSVSEYVDGWWRESEQERRHYGGSWAFGDPMAFTIYAGNGRVADAPSDTVGIRLVARPKKGAS